MAAPKAKTVTLQEIADVFGVTTEAIRLWRKEGMHTRKQSGDLAFVIAECVEWRREKDRESILARLAPDEAKERARKVSAEADLKEMEVAERRGQLIEATVLREVAERISHGFAAAAAGRLARFERDFVRCSSPGEARIISQEIQVQLMEGGRDFAAQLEAEADAEEEASAE